MDFKILPFDQTNGRSDSSPPGPLYNINETSGTWRSGNVTPWETPVLPAYVTTYVILVNSIIFLLGTIGNAMVIVVVARVKDMRSSINLYLVNLSIADLLVLFVCQPTAMAEFYAKERWYLGKELCLLIPVLEHTVLHASTLIVVFITFERYLAICRPHSPIRLSSNAGLLATILGVWFVAAMTSLPFLAMTRLEQSTFYDGSPCQLCLTTLRETWHFYFIVGSTAGFSVFPVIILTILYVPIIRRLRASQRAASASHVSDGGSLPVPARLNGRVDLQLHHSAAPPTGGYRLRTHRQVIRMLVLIVAFFFLSLAPMRILAVWQAVSPPGTVLDFGIETYYNLLWLCRMLMYSNSAVNPLIYSLLSTRFKIAFRLLIRCQSHMLDSRRQLLAGRRLRVVRFEVRSTTSTCSVTNQQTTGSYDACQINLHRLS